MKRTYNKDCLILACAAAICLLACPIIGLELLSTSIKFLYYVGTFLVVPCPFIGFILFVITIIHSLLSR